MIEWCLGAGSGIMVDGVRIGIGEADQGFVYHDADGKQQVNQQSLSDAKAICLHSVVHVEGDGSDENNNFRRIWAIINNGILLETFIKAKDTDDFITRYYGKKPLLYAVRKPYILNGDAKTSFIT